MSKEDLKTEGLTQHDKDLERIAEFTLFDDIFMNAVFRDNIPGVQYILDVILGVPKLRIESVQIQRPLINLRGHSICLDIYAVDDNNKRYDIEFQAENEGASLRRVRYYTSLIDADILERRSKYKNLVDTYVIFITGNDIYGKGLPIYHLDKYIRETGEYQDDGSYILFVNGSYNGDDDIGKLMHDFKCKEPSELLTPVIAERITYLKTDEKGREFMCKMMEDMRNEVELELKRSIARNLIEMGTLSIEDIAKATDLSVDEVKLIAENKSA